MIKVRTFVAETSVELDIRINEWLVEQQKNPFFKIIEWQYRPYVIAEYDYKISAQVVYSYETEEEKERRYAAGAKMLDIMDGKADAIMKGENK